MYDTARGKNKHLECVCVCVCDIEKERERERISNLWLRDTELLAQLQLKLWMFFFYSFLNVSNTQTFVFYPRGQIQGGSQQSYDQCGNYYRCICWTHNSDFKKRAPVNEMRLSIRTVFARCMGNQVLIRIKRYLIAAAFWDNWRTNSDNPINEIMSIMGKLRVVPWANWQANSFPSISWKWGHWFRNYIIDMYPAVLSWKESHLKPKLVLFISLENKYDGTQKTLGR